MNLFTKELDLAVQVSRRIKISSFEEERWMYFRGVYGLD